MELLFSTLQVCFSDYALSVHRSGGLMDQLKHNPGGYVHLQSILNLPPISSITKKQTDLQKALKLFNSDSALISIDETGFKLKRTVAPDFDRLEAMTLEDWDETTLYLENIPVIGDSIISLSKSLGMIFRTSIQTVILPPSYAASSSSHMDRQSSTEDANSQAAQYEKSLALISSSTLQKGKGKERNRDLVLPPGGGPFKGFGFVVVASKADARRILKESEWNRPPPVTVTIKPVVSISVVEQPIPESQATDEDDIEKMMDLEDEKLIRAQVDSILAEEFEEPAVEVELDLNVDLTVLEKQLEMERNDLTQLGRDSGLRATTFSHWRIQSIEYPPYRLSQLSKRPLPNTRPRSPPPHLDRRRESTSHHPSSESRVPSAKRLKQSHADSSSPAKLERNGAPHRRESFFEEEKAEDEFPKGTILWIRGINDKSSKTSLRSLFGDLLNELRGEDSATGIAFVDFEKGLDTCHLRLSSTGLARLLVRHFDKQDYYHLSPTYLSSTSSLTEGQTTHQPKIRSEVLQTEREFIYWTKLARSNPQVWKLAVAATAAWEEKCGRPEDHAESPVVEDGVEEQAEFLKPKLSTRKRATKF